MINIFRNSNKHPKYCVVKLFKTIKQSDVVNIRPCFDVMHEVFISNNYHLTDIEVNYGAKKWRTLAPSFYKFIETSDVVLLSASYAPEGNFETITFPSITYSNYLLNLKNKTEEIDYVYFHLIIPCEWYSLDLIKLIVAKVDKLIKLSYAYVWFLPENYEINTEKPVKKTLFTVSASVRQDDIALRNNLTKIDLGFIPKFYPVNFYNDKQIENLDKDMEIIEKISDNLTLVTFTI